MTKYPRKSTLREGRIYFGSQFQRLQSKVTWFSCFWACDKTGHYGKEQSEKVLEVWLSGITLA
jgi:hypothetical protein